MLNNIENNFNVIPIFLVTVNIRSTNVTLMKQQPDNKVIPIRILFTTYLQSILVIIYVLVQRHSTITRLDLMLFIDAFRKHPTSILGQSY